MSAPLAINRPRLTVAMIVRDAESLLPDTLASASQIADEIVVCDTGSTDATIEIARRYGARVVKHFWTNDFSAARNAACEHAAGEWILWLDAGETIPAESAQALKEFVAVRANSDRAYMLLIVVPAAETNISGEQVGRIRLMPNQPAIRFSERVRETVRPALAAKGKGIDGLPWRIVRGARDNDAQVKFNKAVRDIRLIELSIAECGQTPQLLVALAEAMTTMGDANGAIACFRKALQACELGSTTHREAYYGLLTALDADPEQRELQIATCVEALEQFPLDAQLLCAMGGYLQAEGRIDMAMRAYQTAFEYGQVDPEIWHVPDIFEIAAACLSLAHQLQNNDDDSRRVLEQALARNNSDVRLRRQLIELHVKHDRRKEALAEFDQLSMETQHREAFRSAIRGACLASRENWTPALAYLQTAYSAGCRDVLCLRWLTTSLMNTGDNEAAKPVVRTWRALEPRSVEAERHSQALGLLPIDTTTANLLETTDGKRFRMDTGGLAPHPTHGPSILAPRINIYGPPAS